MNNSLLREFLKWGESHPVYRAKRSAHVSYNKDSFCEIKSIKSLPVLCLVTAKAVLMVKMSPNSYSWRWLTLCKQTNCPLRGSNLPPQASEADALRKEAKWASVANVFPFSSEQWGSLWLYPLANVTITLQETVFNCWMFLCLGLHTIGLLNFNHDLIFSCCVTILRVSSLRDQKTCSRNLAQLHLQAEVISLEKLKWPPAK